MLIHISLHREAKRSWANLRELKALLHLRASSLLLLNISERNHLLCFLLQCDKSEQPGLYNWNVRMSTFSVNCQNHFSFVTRLV